MAKDIRDRTHAAVYFNRTGQSESSKMFAFLSIFHPELSLEERCRLAYSVKD